MQIFNIFKKKKINLSAPRSATKPVHNRTVIQKRKLNDWELDKEDVAISSTIIDRARGMKQFFAAVTRYIPSAKSAVWTWRNLCFTKISVVYLGGTEQEKVNAALEIKNLSQTIYPLQSSKGDGFEKLANAWLMNTFRYGRFSGKIILTPSFDAIDRFDILNPFDVYFEKDTLDAYYGTQTNKLIKQNNNTFYYYGLDSDTDNPYGVAMVEAANTLMQIVNEMFSDMRYSSSNAGTPRLHIKINQPEMMEGEESQAYIDRCNSYFDNTISGMSELAADDNIYTWADVEIKMAGGQNAQGFVWKTNLQAVQEELITAFHLFPWIMGKQFGTTRNWVGAQFDILMQMVVAVQIELASFLDWVVNTHLMLTGNTNVKVKHTFALPRDITAKDTATADKIRLENTEKKMAMGFVDKKTAAREHGYEIID